MIDLTQKTFSPMPVTLDMLASMTLVQLIEVCLTDPAHINGGDPRVKPRMIVTQSFAERWTADPEHYRERFGVGDVEVKQNK